MASSCVKQRDWSAYLADLAQSISHGESTMSVRKGRIALICIGHKGRCNTSHATVSCNAGKLAGASLHMVCKTGPCKHQLLSGRFALSFPTAAIASLAAGYCCCRSGFLRHVEAGTRGEQTSLVPARRGRVLWCDIRSGLNTATRPQGQCLVEGSFAMAFALEQLYSVQHCRGCLPRWHAEHSLPRILDISLTS
jgi:hypothetical protein